MTGTFSVHGSEKCRLELELSLAAAEKGGFEPPSLTVSARPRPGIEWGNLLGIAKSVTGRGSLFSHVSHPSRYIFGTFLPTPAGTGTALQAAGRFPPIATVLGITPGTGFPSYGPSAAPVSASEPEHSEFGPTSRPMGPLGRSTCAGARHLLRPGRRSSLIRGKA
jgi:hypothetical protein